MSFSTQRLDDGPHLLDTRWLSPRQEEVLDIVEGIFLRDGVKAVRIGELAAEASCSRSTLYQLAPSKEELLLLVLDRMLRRIMQRGAKAIAAAGDPIDRVRAVITTGALDLGAFDPRFLEEVQRYPPARLLFDRRIADGRAALEGLIDEAVAAGQLRPVNVGVVAEAIVTVVLRFTDPEYVRATRADPRRELAELADILIEGLRPRAGDA